MNQSGLITRTYEMFERLSLMIKIKFAMSISFRYLKRKIVIKSYPERKNSDK